MIKSILLYLFLLQQFTTYEGKVVSVIDGDTIEVLNNGKAVRIRLNGIDAPEKHQPYGSKAKQFVSDLVFSKTVKIIERDIDRYGRVIADIYIKKSGDSLVWVNNEIIQAGLAWHYKKYSSSRDLANSEEEAKMNKRGLWVDSNPIAPWDWRKSIRSN